MRSPQRTASILTFFAQDSGTHNIVYANTDLLKADQNQEVIAFCDHWRQVNGEDPKLLIFDSKLTTYGLLSQLNQHGIRFLTLPPPSRSAQAARPAAFIGLALGPTRTRRRLPPSPGG